MFGEPDDVEGECNACLFIADNYGDNSATIRCQLPLNHEGQHREDFKRHGGPVTITWTVDERTRCDHGCGQWRHNHGREDITCPKDADDHEFSECAFCHPNKKAQICGLCQTTHYYEEGHKRICKGLTWTCPACGQTGVGEIEWQHNFSFCPKRQTNDEFGE